MKKTVTKLVCLLLCALLAFASALCEQDEITKAAAALGGADCTPLAIVTDDTDGLTVLFMIQPSGPDSSATCALVTIDAGQITRTLFTESGFTLEGWTLLDSTVPSDEVNALLDKATGAEAGLNAEFSCLAVLAKNRTEVTNYLMLCAVTPGVPGAFAEYLLAVVSDNGDGTATLADLTGFE